MNLIFPYSSYIFFSILPSIIWLLFYLRKDVHPEPNRMIIKIFFFGMLATLPIIAFTVLAEIFNFSKTINNFLSSSIYLRILYIFIGIALIEEFLKYLVVKGKVLSNPELDEPTDVILYMIIAALGFAALENLLYLFPTLSSVSYTAVYSGARFIGATFLHALCSGAFGYFLALSIYKTDKRRMFLFIGLFIASFLHGLYNFSIMEMTGILSLLIPIVILICLAIFLSFAFKDLKKLKSVCKI